MMGSTIFADVQDSPIFRLRVAELEASADTLRGRTKKLVTGAARYCQGLEESLQAALAFADVLEEFCGGGTDEESASIGGPTMVRFVHALRELSSFTELLRTQLEVMVCGRLGEEVVAEAAELRDARRLVQQRSAEYDAARARHLGHRGRVPWGPGRGVTPEKSHQDMAAARAAAEEARLDMARKLAAAQLKRRHIFLECIGSVMQSMLKYHQHGLTAMQSVGPYIEQTLALADRHKGDAAAQTAALEELIQGQRQVDEARAASSLLAEAAGATSSGEDSPGPLRLGVAAATAGPPRQMTQATTQLAAELEGFIRATQESGGAQVTVLFQGYLLKQSSKIKSQWRRRFFVLDSNGMLYYYSAKVAGGVGSRLSRDLAGRDQRPQNTVSLLTATVKAGPPPESPPVPFAFRLVSPEREYVLQAEHEAEAKEWMDVLQSAIACLLTGVIADQRPTTPVRPTHTRTASTAASGELTWLPLAAHDAAGSTAAAERQGDVAELASFPLMEQSSAASSPAGLSKEPSFASASPPRFFVAAGDAALAAAAAVAARPAPSPLAALRGVEGNDTCADCGAANPDWGSLNLGTLHCIECSGFHRQMGVHLSKIRSLTLDTRAWEPPVVALFHSLGNAFASDVWEGRLAYVPSGAGGGGADAGDDWACGDSSDDDDGDCAALSLTVRRLPADAARLAKPSPAAPTAAKEKFVKAKYAERRFVRAPEDVTLQASPAAGQQLEEMLWQSVAGGDVRAAYYALASGAEAGQRCGSSAAARLALETNALAGGAQDQKPAAMLGELGDATPLHAAAQGGDIAMAELLLQWGGASVDAADAFGRTPVAYALLYDHPDLAKQLLRRGAVLTAGGAVQMLGRRCSGDAELELLLNAAQKL